MKQHGRFVQKRIAIALVVVFLLIFLPQITLAVDWIIPCAVTDAASGITTNSAVLNGRLLDLGAASSVEVSFEWGLDTNYGNETTPETTTTTGPFSAPLSVLLPDTTYHVRFKAVGEGTRYCNDVSFTTATTSLMVTTNDADDVTTNTATLNGYLNDLGTLPSVDISFEWGLDTSYGSETTPETMMTTGPFNASLSGLLPDTPYHFRAKVVGDGTEYGNDVQFTTISALNQPPDQPSNDSPAGGATGVSLTPSLQSLGFSDPDTGDTHASSQWQITTTLGDYSSPVFNSGTDALNLTSIAVSPALDYTTTYYWHVRHQDNHGAWSNYSIETSFTTVGTSNQSPVADAGSDRLARDVDEDGFEDVVLNGSNSYDPDGTIDLYEWKEGDTVLSNEISFTHSFSLGIHVVTLYVTDNNGTIDSDWLYVEVRRAGNCFIATAAYGTPMAEEIDVLRDVRDQYMLTNPVGEVLVELYYKTSPPVAEFIADHPALKQVVRNRLEPVIATSIVAINTTVAQKIAIITSIMLFSILLVVCLRKRAGGSSTL